MDSTTLDHLNKAEKRVHELKWFEAALTSNKPIIVMIGGRDLDTESTRLVLLAHVREQLDGAQKYFASL